MEPRFGLISKRINSTKTRQGLVKKFNPMVSLKSKAKRSSKRKSAATRNKGQRKRLEKRKKNDDYQDDSIYDSYLSGSDSDYPYSDETPPDGLKICSGPFCIGGR